MRSSNLRYDAADLASTLRALASRAHQMVKVVEGRDAQDDPDQIRHDLADLNQAICSLEDQVKTQNLLSLVPYISALRQKVEFALR